jgi:hypothetical protein
MPIDPFDLYQSFQSYVNTYIGGWFRPQTDFQFATNDISNDLWEKWTKEAEKSQEIRDNLGPFFRSKNIIVTPQNSYYGLLQAPADYGRFASARIILEGNECVPCRGLETVGKDQGKCSESDTETQSEITADYYSKICEHQIDMIDNQRWGSVCQHVTKPPTLDNPKMTQLSNEIQPKTGKPVSQICFKVAPRSVSVVVLDYYIRPTPCVFGYTKAPGNVQTGAGDQIIYEKNTSTSLQWPSTVINEFLIRLGERYGFFTRDQFMAQVSTQQKMMK